MPIHQIVASVARIQQVRAGAVVGRATGFFYSAGERLFLGTNKHVINDEGKGIFPDALRLTLHENPNNLVLNGDFDVSLYGPQGNPLWKLHPSQPLADIALLELNRHDITSGFFIVPLSKANFLPQDLVLNPGEDVFVMGYPMGFYDQLFNLPIFRNAMIASTYGVAFQGHPFFLTDANLHPGTSGSPVLTKPKNTWQDSQGGTRMMAGTAYFFLGVNSGTYQLTLPNGVAIPLGLGVTWYAQLVEDIAQFQ